MFKLTETLSEMIAEATQTFSAPSTGASIASVARCDTCMGTCMGNCNGCYGCKGK